jgi:hypothetical protein
VITQGTFRACDTTRGAIISVNNNRILVVHAQTVVFHDSPEIRAGIEAARVEDRVQASADYGSEWRDDLAGCVARDMVALASRRDLGLGRTSPRRFTTRLMIRPKAFPLPVTSTVLPSATAKIPSCCIL